MSNKKQHMFFERYLDNDLDKLYNYLTQKQSDILEGKIESIPKEELSKFDQYNGPSTQLGNHYNIFLFNSVEIFNLKHQLKRMIVEASHYYDIDFYEQAYMIHGWFNLDHKSGGGNTVSPLNNDMFFHDHMEGHGAPDFHGYYCVNAEPSSTYYKIDNETMFENVNKNNRAIVSETGHPHGRDDWYQEKPRITIAYDIVPLNKYGNTPSGVIPRKWIPL